MSPDIQVRPLSYVQRLESRCTDHITLVVIHCTELPDLAMARKWGEKIVYPGSHTGNSGHFYVDRDGRIEQWVPIRRVAHHVKGFNPQSIGIELVNNGRFPDWFRSDHQKMTDPYPGTQIDALLSLLSTLAQQLTGLKGMVGHEDLDTGVQPSEDKPDLMIRRKLDPGPLFPWTVLADNVHLKRLTARDL